MKYILTAFIISVNIFSQLQQNNTYQYSTDITSVGRDRIIVELVTPKINSTSAVFLIPAYTAGTYKVLNFGRFVSDLEAYDINNNPLTVNRTDTNSWEIQGANALFRLIYKVDDTFDDPSGIMPVFEPEGTNFESGKNFVFNNHGIFGYFEGLTKLPVTVTVTRPASFYATTTLNVVKSEEMTDVFSAPDFFTLTDNPIMFCRPDTASVIMGSSQILFSVYSELGNVKASRVADEIKDVLEAHRNYLGGTLPVEKYAFIFYLFDSSGVSGSAGALEHNTCSFYFMEDAELENMKEFFSQLEQVCSHEFFHIVTPLNLRSEEIADFDFNNPRMSRHLWLYEGVTEYSSLYIMLREGMLSLDKFCELMQGKMNTSQRYSNKISFTDLSTGAFTEYKKEYLNVYQKGALIGFCLDVLIRELTSGEKGLQDIINRLLEKYGKDKPFKDDELFGDIEALTGPSIGDFLRKCVGGTEPLPLEKISALPGLDLTKEKYSQVEFGDINFDINSSNFRIYVSEVNNPSKFYKDLGLMAGDEIVLIDREPVNILNIHEIFGSPGNSFENGDSYSMHVARFNSAGKEKLVELNAKVTGARVRYYYTYETAGQISDKQKKFRKIWMGR